MPPLCPRRSAPFCSKYTGLVPCHRITAVFTTGLYANCSELYRIVCELYTSCMRIVYNSLAGLSDCIQFVYNSTLRIASCMRVVCELYAYCMRVVYNSPVFEETRIQFVYNLYTNCIQFAFPRVELYTSCMRVVYNCIQLAYNSHTTRIQFCTIRHCPLPGKTSSCIQLYTSCIQLPFPVSMTPIWPTGSPTLDRHEFPGVYKKNMPSCIQFADKKTPSCIQVVYKLYTTRRRVVYNCIQLAPRSGDIRDLYANCLRIVYNLYTILYKLPGLIPPLGARATEPAEKKIMLKRCSSYSFIIITRLASISFGSLVSLPTGRATPSHPEPRQKWLPV